MRILLDECVPARLLACPELAGHVVDHVGQSELAGLENGQLLLAARGRYELFITTDRHFRTRSDLQPAPDLGIMVIRVTPNALEVVRSALASFCAAVPLSDLSGRLAVVWRDRWEVF